MADKMPADILWQLSCFLHHFLYIILTEITMTEIVKFFYILNGFCFGDSYESDPLSTELSLYVLICLVIYRQNTNV